MPEPRSFDYALIQAVPRVERGESLNVGVILFCRTARFLGCRWHVDEARLVALWPAVDVPALERQLAYVHAVCEGRTDAGPMARLPLAGRFHWLTSPRSTVIQMSSVHCGLCHDPAATLAHLFRTLVLVTPP